MKLNFFKGPTDEDFIPQKFTSALHPFSLLAAKELQDYLKNQNDWSHNFGLMPQSNKTVIGKMFGVLVVRTIEDKIGHLAAFSGKLADSNQHSKFVPPVFDTLKENGFLNDGMQELTQMSQEISRLKELKSETLATQIQFLKKERKNYSITLQKLIFDNYHFLNQAGEEKSLVAIFKDAGYKNPPAGAGECAAPKLLQYAFQNQLKPLALAEFWWGQSPKSATWKHRQFYAPCKEKCEPILKHMLKGMI